MDGGKVGEMLPTLSARTTLDTKGRMHMLLGNTSLIHPADFLDGGPLSDHRRVNRREWRGRGERFANIGSTWPSNGSYEANRFAARPLPVKKSGGEVPR